MIWQRLLAHASIHTSETCMLALHDIVSEVPGRAPLPSTLAELGFNHRCGGRWLVVRAVLRWPIQIFGQGRLRARSCRAKVSTVAAHDGASVIEPVGPRMRVPGHHASWLPLLSNCDEDIISWSQCREGASAAVVLLLGRRLLTLKMRTGVDGLWMQ